MSRTKVGTWPLWHSITRITVSPTTPVRLARYVTQWAANGRRPRL